MKIYTKRGDKGKTQILASKKYPKDDARIESLGSIDELNCQIGFTVSILTKETEILGTELQKIQELLFYVNADIAAPEVATSKKKMAKFTDSLANKKTGWLEKKIDQYMVKCPHIKKFILPGGSEVASSLHLARTFTRKAERRTVALSKKEPLNPKILIFLNRLSDYFFAVARYANVLTKTSDILFENSKRIFK